MGLAGRCRGLHRARSGDRGAAATLPALLPAVARLCLLVARASYRVDEQEVARFRVHYPATTRSSRPSRGPASPPRAGSAAAWVRTRPGDDLIVVETHRSAVRLAPRRPSKQDLRSDETFTTNDPDPDLDRGGGRSSRPDCRA